ncbi:MAG: hypothetical protein IJI37_05540 [Opitutales bacterium]|nr:hypothetical protein [Opitutales bacterium]
MSKLFPITLIILDLLAAAVYLLADGDWRRFIYWFSAAALTASITF